MNINALSKTRLALVAFAASSIAYAGVGNGTWIGGGATTDWSDAGNWLYGNYPVSTTHALFFKEANQTAPAVLTATQNVYCMYIQLDPRTGANGNEFLPDTIPVTLKEPMNLSLSPNTDVALNISAGRRLVIDGATVNDCGGIYARGELIVRNGATLTATSTSRECKFETPGGRIVVDGATVNMYGLRTKLDSSLEFSVRHGGFFRFDQLYGTVGLPAEWQASVIDGTVWTSNAQPLYNAGLLPARSGELVVRRANAEAFKPAISRLEHHRWGGDVYVTNHVDAALCVTNPSTFYGGGRLFASVFTFTPGHATQTVDLAEINLGNKINFSGWGHTTCYDFVGGTRFGGFGNWRSSEQPNDLYWMILRGDNVFDTLDCFDHATKRTFWMKRMFLQPRSSLAYVGGGEVTNLVEELPPRLAGLCVGAGTTAVLSQLPTARRLATQKLTLAADARLLLPALANAPCVFGEASIDPSSRIVIPLPSTLDVKLHPVYSSLDSSVPTESLDLGGLPEGWTLKTVEGTAYLTNGGQTYEQWDVWTGASSGLWSDGGNWILRAGPTTSARAARFHGETRTVVTNDVDNVEVLRIRTETKSAPFVITGKSIAVTATGTGADSTIYHQNQFPFILRTPLTSTESAFNITSSRDAPVVLAGGLSAPNAKLSVGGSTIAGSTVTAAQFGFLTTSADTVFSVRSGSTAVFTAQSDPIASKGAIWVEPGATMSVAGELRWSAVRNDHRIDGLLDVSGTLGGSAEQGYFGTGVVQVAATTVNPAESATVHIGEGITLKPSAWGSVPIAVDSSATLAAGGDWVYSVAGGLQVPGLGATLAFDTCGHDVTVSTPLVGPDFDVVKKGPGRLALGASNALAGHVAVVSGALAWHADQSFARLAAEPGSVLEFGAVGGSAAKLVLGDSVDLSGVALRAADADAEAIARSGFCTVLTVPEFCEIRNLPEVTSNYKLRVVQTPDGGQALQAKVRNGFTLIVL